MRYLVIMTALVLSGCSSSAQDDEERLIQTKSERAHFARSSVMLEVPAIYESREKESGTYNPRPRIISVDEKRGIYELRWVGYDGQEKVVKYQRRDALDALVEARVEKSDSGYVYYYRVKNLPDSPTHVGSFIIQTFASDILDEPVRSAEPDLYVGQMANLIPRFSKGVWRVFAPVDESNLLLPGTEREFRLHSKAIPGVVECAARAGFAAIKGVGEELPSQLEDALPSYEGFASCKTIGPVERIEKYSKEEKAKYLLDNLPKFVEAGWMAGDTPKIYESLLKREDLAGALKQARKDLESEFITSEVFHIIEWLAQGV